MNLTELELRSLLNYHAREIIEGQPRLDMDRGTAPLRKPAMVEKIERMLQLAKELP